MRRLINIFISISAIVCAVSSCQKEEDIKVDGFDSAVVGEWHLTTVSAEGSNILKDIDVYLCIYPDGMFELYQQSGSQSVRFDKYTGICSTQDNILSGTYSDGTNWGSKWSYSLVSDQLHLVSYNLIERQTYVRKEIPSDIKENANTKSISEGFRPIL